MKIEDLHEKGKFFLTLQGENKIKAMKYCWKKSSVEVGKISVVSQQTTTLVSYLSGPFSCRISEPTIETL